MTNDINHGKPDGAVREALDSVGMFFRILRGPSYLAGEGYSLQVTKIEYEKARAGYELLRADATGRPLMNDPLKPSAGLLAKIGSICQHIDEGSGTDAHAFDIIAARALLADPEVASWLDAMHKLALLPVRRKPDV